MLKPTKKGCARGAAFMMFINWQKGDYLTNILAEMPVVLLRTMYMPGVSAN